MLSFLGAAGLADAAPPKRLFFGVADETFFTLGGAIALVPKLVLLAVAVELAFEGGVGVTLFADLLPKKENGSFFATGAGAGGGTVFFGLAPKENIGLAAFFSGAGGGGGVAFFAGAPKKEKGSAFLAGAFLTTDFGATFLATVGAGFAGTAFFVDEPKNEKGSAFLPAGFGATFLATDGVGFAGEAFFVGDPKKEKGSAFLTGSFFATGAGLGATFLATGAGLGATFLTTGAGLGVVEDEPKKENAGLVDSVFFDTSFAGALLNWKKGFLFAAASALAFSAASLASATFLAAATFLASRSFCWASFLSASTAFFASA